MSADGGSERIGAAVRAAAETVRAPASLREALGQHPRRRRRRLVVAAAAGAAAVAVAVAASLTALLAGGGPSGPSIAEVARAGLAAPTRPAPATDGRYVGEQVGGVRFPDYSRRWGWEAVGARTDRVDGRRAVTVVYRQGELGAHYTIVDGAPIDLPADARRVRAGGERFAVLRDDAIAVVAWHRGGRTCVLSSRTADADRLVAIAGW